MRTCSLANPYSIILQHHLIPKLLQTWRVQEHSFLSRISYNLERAFKKSFKFVLQLKKEYEVSVYFSWAWCGPWRHCLCHACGVNPVVLPVPTLVLRFPLQTGTRLSPWLQLHGGLSSHSWLLQGSLMGCPSFLAVPSILGDGASPCSHLCFHTCLRCQE